MLENLRPEAPQQTRWPLSFTLNGRLVEAEVPPTDTLFTVLRRELSHTGTKGACLEGECGSCTVLVDGVPQTSCLILAPQVQGRAVVTVEGLADGEQLSPLQEAFAACGASQCGYCIPGFLVAATAFLEECPGPTREQIRRGLEGNICRCTGYMKIMEAVERAGAGNG